jgi:sec-independent protein translocase protein TatB
MFGLGFTEIIFLAILALVLIGPKQLPEVARTLGRFLNELKRTTDDMTHDFKSMASSEFRPRPKPDLDEIQQKETKPEASAEALPAPVQTESLETVDSNPEQRSSDKSQKTEPS